MQFPKNIFNNRMLFNMLIMTSLVAGSMTAAFGQRTITDQKASSFAPPSLSQCANGKLPAAPEVCTGSNWQNGNLNENNSQWVEGQSVPYRVVFTDLVANSENNTITIEYDTTEN